MQRQAKRSANQVDQQGQAMLESVLLTVLVLVALIGLSQIVQALGRYDQMVRGLVQALPL